MRQWYIDSGIALKQWTVAELVCLEMGAFLVYLLNHPSLNPIEQVWLCFRLDVTADSLLEMQLRLHHFNQCHLKQARQRGELEVLFFFSPHYLVPFQYVNLKERPPFNLEVALAEHSSRDRKTELERAEKTTKSSRRAKAKLSRSEAGGEKKKKQKTGTSIHDDNDENNDDEDEYKYKWRRRKTRRLWIECATRIGQLTLSAEKCVQETHQNV